MSSGISLVDFANAFAAKTNSVDVPDLAPASVVTIAWWLDDMLSAAEAARPSEVAKYAQMVTERIETERRWQVENVQ